MWCCHVTPQYSQHLQSCTHMKKRGNMAKSVKSCCAINCLYRFWNKFWGGKRLQNITCFFHKRNLINHLPPAFLFFHSPPISPGCETPILYTSTGLQCGGFSSGAPGSAMFLFKPIQNKPHFLLRWLWPQTKLADCSESCSDRKDASRHTQWLWHHPQWLQVWHQCEWKNLC